MILLLPSQSTVLNAYAVLIGATPGNAALKEHQEFIRINGDAGYTLALNNVFKAYTNATMATALLANTGLGGVFTQADAEAYLAANAGNRVGAMISLANELYNYGGTNAAILSAKTAYMASIESSYVYSSVALNTNGQALAGVGVQTVALTTGFDTLVGGALNDTFLARTINNGNTLQDGDSINGGAGSDTLIADLTNQTNAITPLLTNIETVVIRAQTTTTDNTNGNNQLANTVQIDAQRSLAVDSLNTVTAATGVTRWESNNSRSDVIIEDVRIGNSQKTSDVTIAFVESDPGNVDFGVYFDQHSLRNASTGTSTLTIQLMDTGAAAATATAATPLLNQPYDQFKFAVNGVLATVNLNPAGNTTVAAAADTYAQLLAAFQTALVGTGATASLGANFTVTDPISGRPVTGQSIVLTGGAGTVITTPTGSGWFNTTGAAVPATANIYNTFATGATSQTELVTSKIILDDVGRGSTGGDLVVGGMSVGTTSTSRGVERFEIEVGDNSRLQTINSTNNALREVTIVSGATSKTVANAYTTTVTNEGDLTVNGTNFGTSTIIGTVDAALVGAEANSPAGNHTVAGAAGFTDVRLIDASAFKGKFAFTAAISSDTIRKYVTAVDTSANPAADVATVGGNSNFNVAGANFIYTGGNDNDTMNVVIDSAVAGSRSTIVSGLSDVTFVANGGAGNDTITVTVVDQAGQMAGGAQAWYNNQKLNANIAINGGDGNDTIWTPGAGDVIIDAGAGDDLVYTDNTGALGANATSGAAESLADIAYLNAQTAELAAANAIRATAASTDATITTDIVARLEALANGITGLAAVSGVAPVVPVVPVATDIALEALTTPAANIDLAGVSLGYRAISTAQKTQLDAVIDAAVAAGTAATPAHVTALMAIVQPILDAARAADAAAKSADSSQALSAGYLTGTANTVVGNTAALNAANLIVTDLNAIKAAGVVGATDAAILAALETAVLNGSITGTAGTATSLVEAQLQAAIIAGGANTVIQGEVDTFNAILTPLLATAAATVAAATTTLATNVGLNNAAITAIINPVGTPAAIVTSTVADLATDTTTQTGLNTALTTATTKVTDLNALKTTLVANMPDADYLAALNAAVTKGTILAADRTGILTLSNAVVNVAGVVMTPAEKANIDIYINNLLIPATKAVDLATNNLNFIKSIVALDTTAVTIAATAAASGTGNGAAAPKAVYVFDTTNQAATYDRVTMDDRNLADLKSDVNNSNNFFNSTVKVSYKGIDASMIVAGTGFKTTDLEINQALKQLINNNAVLKTLLLATDGPANTLVVTSLIDGTHTTANLAVTVTMPTTVTAADLAGAITAYGLAAGTTDAALLTTMGTAKAAFDTKGDYTTQFAESGAAGGNTTLVGAPSTSSSDNTVTPGIGNDVIVLGTTVGIDAMASSNEKVVYSGVFGNDTIVNFAATGLGIDTLDFTALNGRGSAFGSFVTDKSIVVGAPAATALTAVQIAALFTDSATAINHVYVAVDSTNIGSIWQVADAAGIAATGVVATLVGSIDLADTSWSTLTATNFA